MKVLFVGAGPGDPGLLTVKARDLIVNCRICVYAGSLISPGIIAMIPDTALRFDSAGMTLEQIVEVYRDAQLRDVDVLRLHTGDPSLFGATDEQAAALDKLGIAYEMVPGVSAFQAAAAALGTELTAPEISQTVILSRVAGRTPVPQSQSPALLARTRATLCFYLSIHKIDTLVATLLPEYGADCPARVVFRASWPDQLIIRGTLGDIAAQVHCSGISKTAVILVGEALGNTGRTSRLYDPAFTHEYRRGADS